MVAVTGAGLMALPAATVGAATAPAALKIGVDHVDPANQQPQNGRLFEYTDFFARDFRVVQGQSVTFNFAGFHSVALATSRPAGTAAYPFVSPDADELAANGGPHIGIGPGFFPVQGGDVTHPGQGSQFGAQAPTCGLAGQPVCTFAGGNDFENSGGMAGATWTVQINAAPGTYQMYCTIHPGMTGDFIVVKPGQHGSDQEDINARSQAQFVQERSDALAAEKAANKVNVVGAPGHRQFTVHVGTSAAQDRVAIDEMFPNRPLNLTAGDHVKYVWADNHQVHSVKFPDNNATDPPVAGFDCAAGFVPPGGPPPPCTENGEGPELIFDPGTTPSGQPLRTTNAVVDAGVQVGKSYSIPGEPKSWTVKTDASTAPGTYTFHCTIHDFMTGQLVVP